MTISLCMIVKNEAPRLGACLQSVQGIAAEQIVLDTGSDDGTAAVAEAHGAAVYAFDWQQDFAAARNAALGYATGDWVLVLDADEVLLSEAAAALQAVDQGQPLAGTAAADLLLVMLLRQEVGSQQSPYTLVSRFFRNRPELYFQRPYHETVDDSVLMLQRQAPHWQVATLTGVAIRHEGYRPDAIAQKDKFARAEAIMAAYLAAHPEDPYIANKLGALYGQAGNWDKALPLLQRALAADSDPITRYELHYHCGLAYRHRQAFAQSEQAYRAALAEPLLPQLQLGAYLNLGSLLKQQGRLSEAIAHFEQAIAVDPSCAVAYYNLGVAERARGFLAPAIAAYRQAIALQPDYAEAYQNLGVALFKLGQLPACAEAFGQALRLYDQTNPAAAQALRAGLQQLGLAQGR